MTSMGAVGTKTADKVSVGLATQTGLAGTAAALIIAVIGFIDGDRTPETVGAIVAAAVMLYGVVRGRSDQAAAKIETQALMTAADATVRAPVPTTYAGEKRLP